MGSESVFSVLPAAGARRTAGVGLGRCPGTQPCLLLALSTTAVLPTEQGLRLLSALLLRQLPCRGPTHGIWGDSPEKFVTKAAYGCAGGIEGRPGYGHFRQTPHGSHWSAG
jgi:hypothetical protein